MTGAAILLAAAVGTPLAMLAACLSRRLRDGMPGLLAFAPLPGLAAALGATGGPPLAIDRTLVPAALALDLPGGMLLGTAALLWIAAGAHASAYLRDDPNCGRFTVWWLLTLTGSLGVFMAADLASFFLTFSLVSLAPYGLVVHHDTPSARRAGAIYVALALLSETFLLMGFVLLAAASPHGSLLIRDTVAALPASPWREAALALLILGFGLKLGLVPGHGWMPLAYTAAPIPAAAVLSGAAVKAGVIGLIRFLPLAAEMPRCGEALAAAGLLSAFYGVAAGITQDNPKTVLAYSSVSQMGLIAAVLGMGLAAGDSSAVFGTSFYAAHHVLVKGALFLAIGAAGAARRWRWPVLMPAAVVALTLGGLPFTGGGLAKLAVKAQLGGALVGVLAALSAAASTLLMLHFLRRLAASRAAGPEPAERGQASAGLILPWLAAAFAAVAVPWILYPAADSGTRLAALAPEALWSALWPVLVGAALFAGFRLWGWRLPPVPPGDIVVLGEAALRKTIAWGEAIERADGWLRQWPAASLSLLTFAVVLAAALWAWR